MAGELDNVVKAAKAVCDQVDGEGCHGPRVHDLVRTLRTALAAHEAANPDSNTVSVSVGAIKAVVDANARLRGRFVAVDGYATDDDRKNVHALCKAIDALNALLPPREPPRELVAEWEREAHRADPIGSHKNTTMRERECFEAGFVSACRARWAADPTNGGA